MQGALYDQIPEVPLTYYGLCSALATRNLQHINFSENIRVYFRPAVMSGT
jgi:hypothetical protein